MKNKNFEKGMMILYLVKKHVQVGIHYYMKM